MALISKILGQANPGSALTDLYVVPGGKSSVANLNICNTSLFANTYRVSVAINGAVDAPKQYLAYDTVIPANSSASLTGIYLRAGDVLRVYANVSDVTFVAMGTESDG